MKPALTILGLLLFTTAQAFAAGACWELTNLKFTEAGLTRRTLLVDPSAVIDLRAYSTDEKAGLVLSAANSGVKISVTSVDKYNKDHQALGIVERVALAPEAKITLRVSPVTTETFSVESLTQMQFTGSNDASKIKLQSNGVDTYLQRFPADTSRPPKELVAIFADGDAAASAALTKLFESRVNPGLIAFHLNRLGLRGARLAQAAEQFNGNFLHAVMVEDSSLAKASGNPLALVSMNAGSDSAPTTSAQHRIWATNGSLQLEKSDPFPVGEMSISDKLALLSSLADNKIKLTIQVNHAADGRPAAAQIDGRIEWIAKVGTGYLVGILGYDQPLRMEEVALVTPHPDSRFVPRIDLALERRVGLTDAIYERPGIDISTADSRVVARNLIAEHVPEAKKLIESLFSVELSQRGTGYDFLPRLAAMNLRGLQLVAAYSWANRWTRTPEKTLLKLYRAIMSADPKMISEVNASMPTGYPWRAQVPPSNLVEFPSGLAESNDKPFIGPVQLIPFSQKK